MMAPKPVAAKEGAMKDYEDCVCHLLRLSSNWRLLFLDWVVECGSKRLDHRSNHPTGSLPIRRGPR